MLNIGKGVGLAGADAGWENIFKIADDTPVDKMYKTNVFKLALFHLIFGEFHRIQHN